MIRLKNDYGKNATHKRTVYCIVIFIDNFNLFTLLNIVCIVCIIMLWAGGLKQNINKLVLCFINLRMLECKQGKTMQFS